MFSVCLFFSWVVCAAVQRHAMHSAICFNQVLFFIVTALEVYTCCEKYWFFFVGLVCHCLLWFIWNFIVKKCCRTSPISLVSIFNWKKTEILFFVLFCLIFFFWGGERGGGYFWIINQNEIHIVLWLSFKKWDGHRAVTLYTCIKICNIIGSSLIEIKSYMCMSSLNLSDTQRSLYDKILTSSTPNINLVPVAHSLLFIVKHGESQTQVMSPGLVIIKLSKICTRITRKISHHIVISDKTPLCESTILNYEYKTLNSIKFYCHNAWTRPEELREFLLHVCTVYLIKFSLL